MSKDVINKKPKIVIGLDIGITSVGWSILDEHNNIIDLGSRLFKDASDEKTGASPYSTRREFRSNRRRIIRNRNRKLDLLKLFNKMGWLIDDNQKTYESLINNSYLGKEQEHILDIKCRCLQTRQPLTQLELMRVLYHYLQHRGSWPLTLQEQKTDGEDKIKNVVKEYPQDDIYPSIQLKEHEQKYRFYKGSELSQSISHDLWLWEIKDLLKFNNLDKSFIKEYLNLFDRKRSFSKGPGNEKTPSPYGVYGQLDDKGKPIKNLWDKLIGRCSVYPDEFRGGKNSPITELFNLVNELNNLTYIGSYSSELSVLEECNSIFNAEKKRKLFRCLFDKSKPEKSINVTLKFICNVLDIKNSEVITGYKTETKNGKIVSNAFTKLENYNSIISFLKSIKANIDWNKVDYMDESLLNVCSNIFEIFRKNSEDVINIIENKVREFCFNNWESIIWDNEAFTKLIKRLKLSSSNTSSLSYKAMLEYIYAQNNLDVQINSSKYFDEIIKNNIFKKFKNLELSKKEYKYIPKRLFDNELPISPTVRRSVLQTIKIVNKILKLKSKNYSISSVVIELPRDKNTIEEKKYINYIQEKNKKFIEQIVEENQGGIYSKEELIKKLNQPSLREKVQLWQQQNHTDIYSVRNSEQSFISFESLLSNSNMYEVDHILPFSKSGMDGINNKVLTSKIHNQEKANRTPYEWLSSEGLWNEFKNKVEHLYNSTKNETKEDSNDHTGINKEKRDNLLFMDNLNNKSFEFINKNLSDTRYASKLIFDLFTAFFKLRNQCVNDDTSIKVINGKITNYARYKIFNLPKDRSKYEHHAIDASIIAFIGTQYKIHKFLTAASTNNSEDGYFNNWDLRWLNNKNENIIRFKESILKKSNEVKFSRQLICKDNMGLTDQTIYSFKINDKNKSYKLGTISFLDKKEVDKYFGENVSLKNLVNLVIYPKDNNYDEPSSLYLKLNEIYKKYSSTEKNINPFVEYMKERLNLDKDNLITFLEVEVDGSKVRIKRLKIRTNVEQDDVLLLKKHNNKACLTKLSSLGVRVYKDQNEKLHFLHLTAKFLKSKKTGLYAKLVVDENRVNDWLLENNITNKKYFELKRGQCLKCSQIKKDQSEIFKNQIFYINSFSQAMNTALLLPIDTDLLSFYKKDPKEYKEKCLDKSGNLKRQIRPIYPVLSVLLSNYLIVEMDELGNIYKEFNVLDIL